MIRVLHAVFGIVFLLGLAALALGLAGLHPVEMWRPVP